MFFVDHTEYIYVDGYISIDNPFCLMEAQAFVPIKKLQELGHKQKIEYLDQKGKIVQKIIANQFVFSETQVKQHVATQQKLLAEHKAATEAVEAINKALVAKGIKSVCLVENGQIKLCVNIASAGMLQSFFK